MLFVFKMEAFSDSRLAGCINTIRHARFRRDSRRVHYQSLSVPTSDRLSRVGGIGIAGVLATIGIDVPNGGALFHKHGDAARSEQELDAKSKTHDVRHAPRGTARWLRLSLAGR